MKFAVIAFLASLSACGGGAGTLAGQANKETQIYGPLSAQEKELLGPDQDGNGVRDDVDAWIAHKFPDATHRTQLTNSAQWMTWTILRGYRGNKTNKEELFNWTASINCRIEISIEKFGLESARSSDWKALLFNTRDRTFHYLKWDSSTSGMPTGIMNNSCDYLKSVTLP